MAWPGVLAPVLGLLSAGAVAGGTVYSARRASDLASKGLKQQQDAFEQAQTAQEEQFKAAQEEASKAAKAQEAFLSEQSALLAESANENKAASRRAVEQENLLTRREASRIKARRRAAFAGRRLLLSGPETGAATFGG